LEKSTSYEAPHYAVFSSLQSLHPLCYNFWLLFLQSEYPIWSKAAYFVHIIENNRTLVLLCYWLHEDNIFDPYASPVSFMSSSLHSLYSETSRRLATVTWQYIRKKLSTKLLRL
jgi:hypothetical protein